MSDSAAKRTTNSCAAPKRLVPNPRANDGQADEPDFLLVEDREARQERAPGSPDSPAVASVPTQGDSAAYQRDEGDARWLREGCECERRGLPESAECIFESPCPNEQVQAWLTVAAAHEYEAALLQAREQIERQAAHVGRLLDVCHRYDAALVRISAGPRPDGTYNLSREACEQLAREALDV